MDASNSAEMNNEGGHEPGHEEISLEDSGFSLEKIPFPDADNFNFLVQNAYDGIIVLNGDASIRYLSPSIRRLSGFELEELLSKDTFDLVHPDDVEKVMRTFTEGIRVPGHVEHFECRLRRKDGSWGIAEAISTNLLHEASVAAVVVNVRDITEFRGMEQELRASEERYRYLVENLNAVVFTIDSEGIMTYVSPALERSSGYKTQELVGHVFTDFVHEDDLPGLLESFERVMGGHAEAYEFRVIDKDGTFHYMQTSSRPIVEDGSTRGLLGTMVEITDRVEADEAKRRNEEHFKEVIRRRIRYYRASE